MKRLLTSILSVAFILCGSLPAMAAAPSDPHNHKTKTYSEVSVKSESGYSARIQVYDDEWRQIYNSKYLDLWQTRKIDLRELGLEDGDKFYIYQDLGSVNKAHLDYGPAIYCPISNRNLALKIWGTIFWPAIGEI